MSYVDKDRETGIDSFPIQQERTRDETGCMQYHPSTIIPWWLAELAYKGYIAKWYGGNASGAQTLMRLRERGGFGRQEFLECLHEALKLGLYPKELG